MSSVEGAPLSISYEAAKAALAMCARIDECQDWADKAQALASYVRQAKDETMRKMCDRIQARAIPRCGELLAQVRARPGKRTDIQPREGDRPRLVEPPTRKEAARDAGALSSPGEDRAPRSDRRQGVCPMQHLWPP